MFRFHNTFIAVLGEEFVSSSIRLIICAQNATGSWIAYLFLYWVTVFMVFVVPLIDECERYGGGGVDIFLFVIFRFLWLKKIVMGVIILVLRVALVWEYLHKGHVIM